MSAKPKILVDERGRISRLTKDGSHYYSGCTADNSEVEEEQAEVLLAQKRFLCEYRGEKVTFSTHGGKRRPARDEALYFLRTRFKPDEETVATSAKITSTLHTKYEKRLQAEALRTLLEINDHLKEEFGDDAFVVLKGSSAARLVALDSIRGLKAKLKTKSPAVEKLEADFGKWVTPSDWDAQVIINPKLCNKRAVDLAEDSMTRVHEIIERCMQSMAARLKETREAEPDELRILSQLGGAFEEHPVKKGSDKLLGIESMLENVIPEVDVLQDLRIGKRRSFWVRPFLDERAPTEFIKGQRFRLCSPAAVTKLEYTSATRDIIYMSKNTSLVIPETKVGFDLLRLMACVVGEDGTRYKVELLDVSVAAPNYPSSKTDWVTFNQAKNVFVFRGMRCTSLSYLMKEIKKLVKEGEKRKAGGGSDPKAEKRKNRVTLFQNLVCVFGLSQDFVSPGAFKEMCEEAKHDTGAFSERLKLVNTNLSLRRRQRDALLQLSLDVLQVLFPKVNKPSDADIERVLEFEARLKACDGRATVSVDTAKAIVAVPGLSLDPNDYVDMDLEDLQTEEDVLEAEKERDKAKKALKALGKTWSAAEKKEAKNFVEAATVAARRARAQADLGAVDTSEVNVWNVLADINSCESAMLSK